MEYISYKIKRGNFFFYQENNSATYICNVNDPLQMHSLFLSFSFFLYYSSVSTTNSSEKFTYVINADNTFVY